MNGNIALNNFDRLWVGFDHIADMMEQVSTYNRKPYPPYNIFKNSDTTYAIEIAVAGFTIDEIDIVKEGTKLTISGEKKSSRENIQYIHKGISERNFSHTIMLSENIVVNDASLENGMLFINLSHIIPDDLKPRKIAIGTNESVSNKQFLTEN